MNEANARLQEVVDGLLAGRRDLRVLEAGCGSTSHLKMPPGSRVVGIDISEAQLRRNTHLVEKIQGDLETYPFAPDDFDLIICWDVLEHLPHPQRAIENFVRTLRPEGLIILAMPNVASIKGLVAKLTPFWFHALFYRLVMRDRSAGTEAFRQFPTYLRWAIAPGPLRRWASKRGLAIRFLNLYEGPVQRALRNRNRLVDVLFAVAGGVGRALSLGRWDPNQSDYMIVLEKPARLAPAAAAVLSPPAP